MTYTRGISVTQNVKQLSHKEEEKDWISLTLAEPQREIKDPDLTNYVKKSVKTHRMYNYEKVA
jgi:hypothetical protein